MCLGYRHFVDTSTLINCLSKFVALKAGEEKIFVKPPPVQPKPEVLIPPGACACPEGDENDRPPPRPTKIDDIDDFEQIIDFENRIQNIVYVK